MLIFSALAIASALAGCTAQQAEPPKAIKIGLIAELTGDRSIVGVSCKNAAELAVQEVNDAGGLEVSMKKYKYDSFQLLFSALQGAAKVDREAVRGALARQSIEGVTGPIRFRTGTGDPVKSAVVLQINGGKFVWFSNVQP